MPVDNIQKRTLPAIRALATLQVLGTYTDTDTVISLKTGQGAKAPDTVTEGGVIGLYWAKNPKNPWDPTYNASHGYDEAELDPAREWVWIDTRSADVLTVRRGEEDTPATAKDNPDAIYVISICLSRTFYDVLEDSLPLTFRAYGAKGNGIDDDTDAIEACLQQATGNGNTGGTARRVCPGSGNFRLTRPIIVPAGSLLWQGDGYRDGTRCFYAGTDGGDMLTFVAPPPTDAADGIVIRDTQFRGTYDENSGSCLVFDNCVNMFLDHLWVHEFGGGSTDYLTLRPAIVCKVDLAKSIQRAELLVMEKCKVNVNRGGGVWVDDGFHFQSILNTIAQNGKFGIHLFSVSQANIKGRNISNYGFERLPGNPFPGAMSYGLTVDSGEDLYVENVDFELCGGVLGSRGAAIRVGFDGVTQQETNNTLQGGQVVSCTFDPESYMDCIELGLFLDFKVSGNNFQWGSNVEREGIVLRNGGAGVSASARLIVSHNRWRSGTATSSIFPQANRLPQFASMPCSLNYIDGEQGSGNIEHDVMRMIGDDDPGYTMVGVRRRNRGFDEARITNTGDYLVGDGTSLADLNGIMHGGSAPEGNVTASRGVLYLHRNGGIYKKTTDASNTGWVQL